MKNQNNSLQYLFYSTLAALFIWMLSPTVKAHITPANTAAFPLMPYEARYTISYLGVPAGESVHTLREQQNGQFHFQARTEPNMSMLPYHYHESTHFSWQNGTIVPQNYYYNRKEGKRHRTGNVSFDWENSRISNKELKQPWLADIEQGTQNKLTQTLCLRQALLSGSRDLQYTVAEEDKIRTYHFTIVGEEPIKTKLGTFNTLKLEHVSRKGVRTTFWLAKTLDYLPVKMNQIRQGKVVGSGEIISFTPQRGQNVHAKRS